MCAQTDTPVHMHTAFNLGELSVCVCALFFISVADAWEAPLSLSGFSGKEWWKKLDMDVRATLHLDAGYPLSKHRTQLANESDQQTQKQGSFFKGVILYEVPLQQSSVLRLIASAFILKRMRNRTCGRATRWGSVSRCACSWFMVSDSYSRDRCSTEM